MTVQELIEKLKTFPPDARVSLETKLYGDKAIDVNYEVNETGEVWAVITDYE